MPRPGETHWGSSVMSRDTLLALQPRHCAVGVTAGVLHEPSAALARLGSKAPVSRDQPTDAAPEPAREASVPAVAAASGRRRKRQTEPVAPPPIRIEIDPAVSAGYIHDRYDLLVRGRVVSGVPVEEVAVRLDDVVIGRVQYGQSDQVAEASQADDDGGIQHVFHINVPLRRAQAHRMCTCTIAARMHNGDTHEESFDFAVDPSNAMPVSVASGPTRSSSTYAHLRPSVVLYVERAALDDSGQLLVQGWVVSLTAVVAVQVFIDEENIGAAQLGGQRDDVGTAFPAYPNARLSGFMLSKHIDVASAAVSTLRVQAISLNGFLHEAVLPVERMRALAAGPPVAAASASISAPTPILSSTLQQPAYRLVTSFRLGPDLPSLLSTPIPSSPAVRDSVRDPRREIRFYCDRMDLDAEGNLNVDGWAVCAIGISTITVHLDDREMGEAELGLPRADVGEEYRHIPMARYAGFRFAKRSAMCRPANIGSAWCCATGSTMCGTRFAPSGSSVLRHPPPARPRSSAWRSTGPP